LGRLPRLPELAQHLLLLAQPLLAEGLRRLLDDALPDHAVVLAGDAASGTPALVVWLPEERMEPLAL
jgi:hypothetical protein